MKIEFSIDTGTIISFFVVLVIACLAAAFFLRQSCDSKKRQKCYRDSLTFSFRVAQNIPDNAVVFVGDSHIRGLCVVAVTPYGVNLGIGGDTTGGVLQRIKQYMSLNKAKVVVLAIGTNDIIHGLKDGIADRYTAILNVLSGSVPVLVCSLPPVDERATGKIHNQDVLAVNRSLLAVCTGNTRCCFVDCTKQLVDFSGNLDARYHIGDGIHLSPAGYAIWIKTMKQILSVSDCFID